MSQFKIPKEIRVLRAKSAQKVKQENWIKNRELRLESIPFDELNIGEKREKILREQNFCCNICGLDTWNSKPITLEMDHINGDRQLETRENLRFICPNCHSQTDTYKVLNNKVPGKKTYSDEEIINSIMESDSLYKAISKLGMNPHGGNYTRFRKIIKDNNLKVDWLF